MIPIPHIDQAVQFHMAGNLQEAERCYRQILQANPRHFDAWHLLGVLCLQIGRSDLAVNYIGEAVRLRPDAPEALGNLGNALGALGRLDEAVACYRQVLRLRPDQAEGHYNLGTVLHRQRKLDEAVASYRMAVRLKPNFAEAHDNLGNVLNEQGKLDEAIACHQAAVRIKPDLAVAHNNLGNALQVQGKFAEAAECFQLAARHKPDFAEAHNNLGNVLGELGHFDLAISCLQQALRLKPADAEAHSNLGRVLYHQGKFDEAVAWYRQALRLRPDYAMALYNLGAALHGQDKLDEAVECYRQALRIKPDFAGVYCNLGNSLHSQGKLDEADACYQQALRLDPGFAEVRFILSLRLLLRGNFAQGWPEYEWRWQSKLMRQHRRHVSHPLWDGKQLRDGVILLHAEQGLGDTMQFIRFAKLVKERVGTVLFECPPELARLLRGCAGIDKIIPWGDPPPAFDVQAPLMSLPGILKTTLSNIPSDVPYIHALRSEYVASRLNNSLAPHLSPLTPDFKIGVVWQGNPKTWDPNLRREDARRSMSLAHFERLARVPGVRLFSLQKGHGTEQLEKLAGRFPIVELGSTCHDFSDTAAVMKGLDLVISADTSPAHLAGALGVPVWVALPFVGCWRWLLNREDSPWYPTMRLFRQSTRGDWDGVFERMAEALTLFSRSPGASAAGAPRLPEANG